MRKIIYFLSFLVIIFIFLHKPAMGDEQKSLKDGALKLEDIVVTATKTSHTLEDTPITTHLITQEEIKKSNAKTAGEALVQF